MPMPRPRPRGRRTSGRDGRAADRGRTWGPSRRRARAAVERGVRELHAPEARARRGCAGRRPCRWTAWWRRWTAAHSRGRMPVAIQRNTRQNIATAGCTVSDLWVTPRCRYTLVTRSRTCARQEPDDDPEEPMHRRTLAVARPASTTDLSRPRADRIATSSEPGPGPGARRERGYRVPPPSRTAASPKTSRPSVPTAVVGSRKRSDAGPRTATSPLAWARSTSKPASGRAVTSHSPSRSVQCRWSVAGAPARAAAEAAGPEHGEQLVDPVGRERPVDRLRVPGRELRVVAVDRGLVGLAALSRRRRVPAPVADSTNVHIGTSGSTPDNASASRSPPARTYPTRSAASSGRALELAEPDLLRCARRSTTVAGPVLDASDVSQQVGDGPLRARRHRRVRRRPARRPSTSAAVSMRTASDVLLRVEQGGRRRLGHGSEPTRTTSLRPARRPGRRASTRGRSGARARDRRCRPVLTSVLTGYTSSPSSGAGTRNDSQLGRRRGRSRSSQTSHVGSGSITGIRSCSGASRSLARVVTMTHVRSHPSSSVPSGRALPLRDLPDLPEPGERHRLAVAPVHEVGLLADPAWGRGASIFCHS